MRALRAGLAIVKRVFGPQHHMTAASLINLARLLHAQGDLAGARSITVVIQHEGAADIPAEFITYF